MAKSYYITTPIYYVNDKPHIGHAYTTLACDVLARFKRLDGFDVMFLTGTDEHGQKVEKAAKAAGKSPQAFTDEVSQNFRRLAEDMNYSNDDFIRTTEPRHEKAVQELWRRMKANGDIYLGSYSGWYSVRDEAFYTDAEVSEREDGQKVGPTGAEVEWVEEPSYFFRLSAWQDRLLQFYADNPESVGPESRRNEVVAFVKSGLNDLSISRTSFDWGIPVPDDPDHIVYVWFDALINYITGVGYPDTDQAGFQAFWPADVHMVGKDILRFHAVFWPAFLMSAGVAPAQRVYAHGWLLNRGEKMSKSVGNVLSADDLVARYGLDQVRYYLLREVPFGQDGYISHESMVGRINSDLANDLGNLAQRVLSMINRNCAAAVPAPGPMDEADEALLAKVRGVLDELRREFDRQAFHRGLEALWQAVGEANRYVDAQAPWALRKTDPDRMNTVLYVLADVIRRLGILVQPVMPGSAAGMLDQLAVPAEARGFADLETALGTGTALPKPAPVFPRFVEEEAAQ